MNDPIEPLFIDHPGAGRLVSQTLDQYLEPLIPEHPARKELAQLRSLALDGMKVAHDLVVALQKINELEKKIADLDPDRLKTLHVPPNPLQGPPLPPEPYDYEAARKKNPASAIFACPDCAKTFASKQGLQLHIHHKHTAKND